VRTWRLAMAIVSLAAVASAAEVGGIRVDARTSLGASELVLNGAGLRKRAFFKVRRRSLPHRKEDVTAGRAGARRPKACQHHVAEESQHPGARRRGEGWHPPKQFAGGAAGSERPHRRADGRPAGGPAGQKGDVLTVDWLPYAGTLVALNGEVKSHAIPGEDVYRALLNVWLGDNPTSAGLKKALLGQAQ